MQHTEKYTSTSISDIYMRMDGILEIRVKEDSEVDEAKLLENFNATIPLTGGKQVPALLDCRSHFTITNEARKLMANVTADTRSAHAVVLNSLAIRLIANFYLNVNKPSKPSKVFSNYDEAVSWLKGFVN